MMGRCQAQAQHRTLATDPRRGHHCPLGLSGPFTTSFLKSYLLFLLETNQEHFPEGGAFFQGVDLGALWHCFRWTGQG